MLPRAITFAILFVRGVLATVFAVVRHAPGQRFGVFGRRAGLRAMLAGHSAYRDLLLTPVNIVRYWEFPFVERHLPRTVTTCLDVSSPRLFSLYLASRRRGATIRVINPDPVDLQLTASLAAILGRGNVTTDGIPVAALAKQSRRYDAIWSISVVEHIPAAEDTEAMALMYDVLAPGGHLLVTVPVDRRAWEEFRDVDTYGLGLPREEGGYFFQRWYDEGAIWRRLIEPLGPDVARGARLEWFGERIAGRFAAYEQDWMRRGHRRTVDDPIEIARHYRSFETWQAMPGQGVCGIVLIKHA